jgi:hypothetical protein
MNGGFFHFSKIEKRCLARRKKRGFHHDLCSSPYLSNTSPSLLLVEQLDFFMDDIQPLRCHSVSLFIHSNLVVLFNTKEEKSLSFIKHDHLHSDKRC